MISANYAEKRIDIDADESVHHVKTENLEDFGLFLEQLQQHRLYTQNISNNGQVDYLDEVLVYFDEFLFILTNNKQVWLSW